MDDLTFTLVNPVNVYLADYFSRRGDNTLRDYLDKKIDELVVSRELTTEKLLQEMKIIANDGGLTADEIFEAAMRELTLIKEIKISGDETNE